MLFLLYNYKAVSYTHLDVYKRQAIYRSVYAHTYEEAVEVLEEAEERVHEEVELQRLLRRQKTQQQTTGILQRAFSHDEMLKVVRTLTLQEWMIEWLEGHKRNTIRPTSYMRYYNCLLYTSRCV